MKQATAAEIQKVWMEYPYVLLTTIIEAEPETLTQNMRTFGLDVSHDVDSIIEGLNVVYRENGAAAVKSCFDIPVSTDRLTPAATEAIVGTQNMQRANRSNSTTDANAARSFDWEGGEDMGYEDLNEEEEQFEDLSDVNNEPFNWLGLIDTVFPTILDLLTGGNASNNQPPNTSQPNNQPPANPPAKEAKSPWLWIWVGLGALALTIGGVVWYKKRKK